MNTPQSLCQNAPEGVEPGRQALVLRRRPGHAANEKVLTSGTGLYIPSSLSFEDWERAGAQLSGIIDSSCWWLGDWLVFGKRNYADRYRTAIRAAGLRYQTLRNYAWVARRFEFTRRRPKLTFQHHAEVASLPMADQEHWLDQAEQLLWTTKQLRSAIRGDQSTGQLTESNSRIEVPPNRVGRWRMAAHTSGVELEMWILNILDQAAQEVLNQELADSDARTPLLC
ncbi:MAG: LmbU family transcriptional regulator [Jatrophihabitantaceae bacterium]